MTKRPAIDVADLVAEAEHRLLKPAELAVILAVTPRWVSSHTGVAGGLPHVQLGRFPRYDLARVRVWLDEHEEGGSRRLRRAS